ncbi:MAG: DNA recombination protein RmuC [Deltaproteobacteria bacterium]|nr:DNA recombination protein RmuC [Deltaproteobacteria bacterium]
MEIAVIALLAVLAASVLFLALSIRRRGNVNDARMLETQYESLRAEVRSSLSSNLSLIANQLANTTKQVNDQLSSVAVQLHASTGQIGQRMDSASKAVADVRQGLGELSKAAERIFDVGKDISSLQEILRSPKLRGGLGELFLGDLLGQCLPSTHFELQYTFKTGARVDGVIRLKGGLVPIDAKFPLENFRKAVESPGEEARKAAKRRFIADCRKHIDAIAGSYILPSEGTLNFALMYIPAENVYYEAITGDGDDTLAAYAFSKRVIPVSPNSFYAYLQTILLGLKGLEVSERAQSILSRIEGLRCGFDGFMADFDTLGRHISNTKAKYDEVDKKAGRFAASLNSLGQIEGLDPEPRLKGEGEKTL